MSHQVASTILTVVEVTLETVNAEIAERQAYLRDQETTIATIINDGNNYLLDLNYQIEAAKTQLKDHKAKLYELSRERYQAEQDLKQLREDIASELNQAGYTPSFGV